MNDEKKPKCKVYVGGRLVGEVGPWELCEARESIHYVPLSNESSLLLAQGLADARAGRTVAVSVDTLED